MTDLSGQTFLSKQSGGTILSKVDDSTYIVRFSTGVRTLVTVATMAAERWQFFDSIEEAVKFVPAQPKIVMRGGQPAPTPVNVRITTPQPDTPDTVRTPAGAVIRIRPIAAPEPEMGPDIPQPTTPEDAPAAVEKLGKNTLEQHVRRLRRD